MAAQQVSDLQKLFDRSVDEFDRRVQHIKDDQWELPTPCSEWNVRDLVNHLVNEDKWATPMLESKTIEEVGDAFDGDLLGDSPVAVWESAAGEARAAVDRPGALDATVHASFGDITGRDYVEQLLSDHVIHAWDLARAIGDTEDLDPELVELCYAALKPIEDALKGSGSYGDKVEVPEDADTQAKLLAVAGRRV
jgi:uncharacterized protein (TIGR03086 family)